MKTSVIYLTRSIRKRDLQLIIFTRYNIFLFIEWQQIRNKLSGSGWKMNRKKRFVKPNKRLTFCKSLTWSRIISNLCSFFSSLFSFRSGFKRDYESVQTRLNTLPDERAHQVMVNHCAHDLELNADKIQENQWLFCCSTLGSDRREGVLSGSADSHKRSYGAYRWKLVCGCLRQTSFANGVQTHFKCVSKACTAVSC